MRKKLLIASSWYPDDIKPFKGIFIEDQAVALSKAYDVMVLHLPKRRLFGVRSLLKGRVGVKAHTECRAGIKVYRTRVLAPLHLPATALWPYYLWVTRHNFKKVLAMWGKPHLIHAHVVLPAGWVAMKLGLEYNIPVILTEHTSKFSALATSTEEQPLVRETLIGVNRVVAVSPTLRERIHAFDPEMIVDVVGNIIRTDFFTPSSDGRVTSSKKLCTRFLTVASLYEGKGLHHLLQAAQLLIQKGITCFELIVGGDGPESARLKNMVDELGLSDRCRFLGMLTRTEVRAWMQQCGVFILPSLGETFGVVLGEAMACGKPVIATRCGGPEFVVTPETGILVNAADPAALAEVMAGFISNQFKFDASQIRQSVQARFGEEAFRRNISAMYEQFWV